MFITEKTLKDLEFPAILELIQEFTSNERTKQAILQIKPMADQINWRKVLGETDEFATSFSNQNRVPITGLTDISKSLFLLGIENTFLDGDKLLDLAKTILQIDELHKFFNKFKLLYPWLYQANVLVPNHPELALPITDKIDKYGGVLDDATPLLKSIRKEISVIDTQIGSSFEKAMQQYAQADYLDEIRESVVEGKRVLAVQAMYRKKVSGSILGTSKTGSIIFMLPQATYNLEQDLQLLKIQEKDEVLKILKHITDCLRPHIELLHTYHTYLTSLDVTGAKARYAHSIDAILPKIVTEKKISLQKAYHPLLLKSNKLKKLKTIPQSIELNENQQIIVISGPNAGGKSLTLKTIGLLQVMLQSGILIPVDTHTECSFFDTILTDIGDNQSIENQLSTYSYRLKNMRIFLKKCHANTLFLIDEFGTGSDPELGGALAEVFLEDFYHKKAFGVITTHYTNIKALADQLPFAVNANMQFDQNSLEPKYELVTGQAGSSFTFEVAQKNGIPYGLINRAKKRVSGSKIRLDKTISKLQTERSKMKHHADQLVEEKEKVSSHTQELVDKQQRLQQKLEQFQALYDNQQRILQYGRIVNEWLNRFFQTGNKKLLLQEFQKWVMSEKVKYTKKNPPKKETKLEKVSKAKKLKNNELALKKTEKEVLEKIVVIREDLKEREVAEAHSILNYDYQKGDTVRLIDGWAQGTVEKVDKKKLLINYGNFMAQADRSQIELIKKNKK